MSSCFICSERGPFVCSRCRKFRYCGAEHQAQHWKAGHKKECRPPAVLVEASKFSVVRNKDFLSTKAGGGEHDSLAISSADGDKFPVADRPITSVTLQAAQTIDWSEYVPALVRTSMFPSYYDGALRFMYAGVSGFSERFRGNVPMEICEKIEATIGAWTETLEKMREENDIEMRAEFAPFGNTNNYSQTVGSDAKQTNLPQKEVEHRTQAPAVKTNANYVSVFDRKKRRDEAVVDATALFEHLKTRIPTLEKEENLDSLFGLAVVQNMKRAVKFDDAENPYPVAHWCGHVCAAANFIFLIMSSCGPACATVLNSSSAAKQLASAICTSFASLCVGLHGLQRSVTMSKLRASTGPSFSGPNV